MEEMEDQEEAQDLVMVEPEQEVFHQLEVTMVAMDTALHTLLQVEVVEQMLLDKALLQDFQEQAEMVKYGTEVMYTQAVVEEERVIHLLKV